METKDHEAWLIELQMEGQQMVFYDYRLAELLANCIEVEIKNKSDLNKAIQETFADCLFKVETKILAEIKKKHDMTVSSLNVNRALEILYRHWIHGAILHETFNKEI